MTPVEGPRCSVRWTCATPWPSVTVDPYRMATDVLDPLLTTGSFGGGDRPARGSALSRARRRGLRRPPAGRAGWRSGCSTRDRPPPRSRSPGARAGWSTYAGDPSPRSRGASSSGPRASPPPGSTATDRRVGRGRPGSRAVGPGRAPRLTAFSPRSRSSSSSRSTPSSRSQRMFRRRSAPGLGAGAGQLPHLDPPDVLQVAGPQGPSSKSAVIVGRSSFSRATRNSSETSTVPGLATPTSRLARLTTGP